MQMREKGGQWGCLRPLNLLLRTASVGDEECKRKGEAEDFFVYLPFACLFALIYHIS